MKQQFCGNCGSKLPSDSMFCSNCGTTLQQQADKQEQSSVPFWKKYKWLIVGLAAAAVVFVIFQMQNDKPEKVATDFVTHLSNADIDKA